MRRAAFVVVMVVFSLHLFAQKQSATLPTPAVEYWIGQMADHHAKIERLGAKLKQLMDKPGADKPGGVPRELFCQLALESALAVAGTKAHFVDDDGEEFHLLVNSAEEGDAFDLFYTFSRTGKLLAATVAHLPKGWKLGFTTKEPSKYLYVFTDNRVGCSFQFGLTDPFDAFATKDTGSE